jgi:hypothetical protein
VKAPVVLVVLALVCGRSLLEHQVLADQRFVAGQWEELLSWHPRLRASCTLEDFSAGAVHVLLRQCVRYACMRENVMRACWCVLFSEASVHCGLCDG